MYEEQHFTHDAATVVFHDDADGISVDEDGNATVDWNEVEVVHIENPPHAEAFGTKDFYKLPATVAKPIRQPYQFRDSTVWLKKPREELKKASWSLDNAPWTLGHPDSGMVKNVHDIHGFWKNPRYIDAMDDLDADLHIPVDDEEAKAFISENSDVSVGFYNRIARTDEYDGIVGGEDDHDDDIDGYQTDMYFDHVASVKVGRCSGEAGCGIDSPSHGHTELGFISGTVTTEASSELGMGTATDQSQFVHPESGDWYAVPPSDNQDDEWKFPINSCSDVEDAWKLRHHGDISISVDTLEDRIQRRANDLGCDEPSSEGEETDSLEGMRGTILRYRICPSCDDADTEPADDCDGCGSTIKIGRTLKLKD